MPETKQAREAIDYEVPEGERQYLLTLEMKERLDNTFTYHAPKGDQQNRYMNVREMLRRTAEVLVRSCPPSRELSVALTELETCGFWANASISRNE